jgi:NTE family protein
MNTTVKTAFVLAGGGSLGAVEVGMLRALAAAGLRPDLIVGASAGAINGTHFAADPSPAGVARLEAVWRGITRRDVMPLGLRDLLRIALRRGEHMVDPRGLRRVLSQHLGDGRLEDAAVPVHVVATDRLLGTEVVLSRGPVVDAVLASTAIPGVFPPVTIDGRELIDGGVANNTPISTALRLGAQRIVVLPTGFACALKRPPGSAIGHAMHALSLLVGRQLMHDVERYRSEAALHVVPPLCPVDTSPYDYSAAGALIDRAARSTHEWIEGGGLERSDGAPHQMVQHTH